MTSLCLSIVRTISSVLSTCEPLRRPFASSLNLSSSSSSVMGFFGWPLGSSTCADNVLPSPSFTVTLFAMLHGYDVVRSLSSFTITLRMNSRTLGSPSFCGA